MAERNGEQSAWQKKEARRRRREKASEINLANVGHAGAARRDADAVASGLARLAKEEGEGERDSRQVRRARARDMKKLQERRVRLLERDDEYIREQLGKPGGIEGWIGIEGTADADEALHVLIEQLGLLPRLQALRPGETRTDEKTGKKVRRREMYAPEILNLLSVLMRFLGLATGPEVQTVILTDPRWMGRLGFTMQEVEEGATRRSASLTGKTRDGEGGRFEEAGELGPARNREDLQVNRGALSSQTLSAHEEALPLEGLVSLLNEAVRKVAALGVLPKKIDGSLDSTCLEVSPQFEGAGVTRRKVKVHSKNRRPRQVECSIRGFKVWILIDTDTGIPLSAAMATIEVGDIIMARQVVEQALANIEGHAVLTGLAVDRGFLDGDFLYWLKTEKRIDWTCPSKEKMAVTAEARQRVNDTLAASRQKREDGSTEEDLEVAVRLARRMESRDGVSFHEHVVTGGRPPLVIAAVADLLDTDFYGPGGSSSSRVNSKKYRPTPLYATVVLNWPDRPRQDLADEQEHDEEGGRGPVVLLSPLPEPGPRRYDRYDKRSVIENKVNREGKQHFSLGTSLARNESAIQAGTYFSLLALLIWRVLLVEQEWADNDDRRAERLGITRYRRKMLLENRGKVMVWADGRFGLIDMFALGKLLGLLRM
jgi:hypothetical protein